MKERESESRGKDRKRERSSKRSVVQSLSCVI